MPGAAPTEPVQAEEVVLGRPEGAPLHAYLALPGPRPAPGLVVIHEIQGLDAQIQGVAARLALAGYAALAVDLFSVGDKASCLARVFYGLLIRPLANGVVGDLRAALDYLGGRPEVQPARLGVIGFCLGGSYALQLACVDGRLQAASVFYGQNPRPLQAVGAACPLVGSYPEKDFTARAARRLERALTDHGVRHDIRIYPGTRHSFFNESRGSYDRPAAEDAWQRTLLFFAEHLKPSGSGIPRP